MISSLLKFLRQINVFVESYEQMKLITVYSIVDRLKINGSCARAGIRELVKQGKIVEVSKRGHFILTRICFFPMSYILGAQ